MFSGSLSLRGISISHGRGRQFTNGAVPLPASPEAALQPGPSHDAIPVESQPVGVPEASGVSQGRMFIWAVPEGDLGSHKVNDLLMTTLSATYGGSRVGDYVISAGALPSDIKLNHTRGILSGTLLQTGHYVFTIRATIESASSDATYNITVA